MKGAGQLSRGDKSQVMKSVAMLMSLDNLRNMGEPMKYFKQNDDIISFGVEGSLRLEYIK